MLLKKNKYLILFIFSQCLLVPVYVYILKSVNHCHYISACFGEKVKAKEKLIHLSDQPIILSTNGSTRATAFQDLGKIVELDNGFIISWLDNQDGKFRLKLRYFSNKYVSKLEYDLGEVIDNHGGGSLAVTKGNVVHVAYFPHGDNHALYRIGVLHKDSIDWKDPIPVGDHLTYPKLYIHNHKIYLTARRTRHSIGVDPKPEMVFYEKINPKKFSSSKTLVKSRLDGYSNFNLFINDDIQGKKSYITLKKTEGSSSNSYGIKQTIILSQSSKSRYSNPLLSLYNNKKENKLFILKGGIEKQNSLSVGPGIQIEKKFLLPFVIRRSMSSELFIFNIDKKTKTIINLTKKLTNKYPSYSFTEPMGGLAIDQEDNAFLVTTVAQIKGKRPAKYLGTWGEESSAIFVYVFNPFDFSEKCKYLFVDAENEAPEWLPHLKTIHGKTILMYTSGDKGNDNSDDVKTNVILKNLTKYTQEHCS